MDKVRELVLLWRISDFLPISEDLGTIEEYIIPENQEEAPSDSAYWSTPEILLDIRWILEASDNQDNLPNEHLLASQLEYEREECQFSQLRHGFQRFANSFYTCNQKIEKIYDEKKAFIDFWNQYKQVIANARPRWNENGQRIFINYDPATLIDAAAQLLAIESSNDPTNLSFQANIRKNLPHIKTSYSKMLDSARNLLNERDNYENKSLFASRVNSFYTKYLFQLEEKQAGQELSALNKKVKKFIHTAGKKSHTPRENKWDSKYRDSIWTDLQQTATSLCESITPTMEANKITYFQTPGDLVAEVTKEMGIVQIHDSLIKAYRKESGEKARCIAMLDANNHNIRILALSGFLDCDDPQLKKYREEYEKQKQYINNQMLLEKLNAVCENLSRQKSDWGNIELAKFSSDVVDNYHFYETEASEKWECLRAVLGDRDRWPQISKNKACCERKILAKLESEGRTGDIQSGALIIKFPPCERCQKSLNQWEAYEKRKIEPIH